MKKHKNKQMIVAVSGGFDPIHIGHVRMMEEAKKLAEKLARNNSQKAKLVVIINNDNWLVKKKGYFFMSQNERKEIIEAIRYVDQVILTKHPKNPTDMSVCQALLEIRPDIFCNGGDRKNENDIPETAVCKKINCQMVFNTGHGGKIQSSSWLLGKFAENYKKNP